MHQLINELMSPSTDANGVTIPVSSLRVRAARALADLHDRSQSELQNRLLAEHRERLTFQELMEARAALAKEIDEEISAYYKDAMNEDYRINCT